VVFEENAMKRIPCLTLAAGLLAAALPCLAAGEVEVNFVEPSKYIDAGSSSVEIDRTTKALGAYLKRFGRDLPDGQTLRIEVLDIDLAGWVRTGSRADTRVLRGTADGPRIKLRYTLQADGRVLAAGEQTVVDLDYLNQRWRDPPQSDLPYEERMLERWFAERFGDARAQ
jgi:hypothetical protein